MPNRFYTVLIVPEKSSEIRRYVIPGWILRSGTLFLAFVILLAGVMIFDYWYVIRQIGENKNLKIENRRLRQQVQIFQNKITTVENTLERIKSFATRLKILMHTEGNNQGKLPDATPAALPQGPSASLPASSTGLGFGQSLGLGGQEGQDGKSRITPELGPALLDPEEVALQKESIFLESKIANLNRETFQTEELLQDQYEILYDKKAFLSALPTRQPAPGYFTSGFGIRTSPYGDRIKMHEGLDIANHPGTIIRAPANGEVIFADSKVGYGLTLILNHGYGIETWYAHLKQFIARKGDKIKRGNKIALLGNSGRSTGPHVHYEVHVHGVPVDPRSYIFEDSNP